MGAILKTLLNGVWNNGMRLYRMTASPIAFNKVRFFMPFVDNETIDCDISVWHR